MMMESKGLLQVLKDFMYRSITRYFSHPLKEKRNCNYNTMREQCIPFYKL